VAAEIPPQIAAFRRQQYRWACGSVQVLRKLLGPWWASRRPAAQRVGGVLHLSAYLAYPLMLLALLSSLPLELTRTHLPAALSLTSVAGLGPPILFIVSQWAAYPRWPKQLTALPALFFLGLGLTLNNSWAVLNAFFGRPEFARTPKFNDVAHSTRWLSSEYVLKPDGLAWAHMALTAYAALALAAALQQAPALVPFSAMMLAGCSYVMVLELAPLFRARLAQRAGRRNAPLAVNERPQKTS
jgi:hypothetical protein